MPATPPIQALANAAVRHASPEQTCPAIASEAEDLFGPSIACFIDRLCRDESQPRKTFSDEELHQLAATIKAHGILEPILVRRGEGEKLIVIAGERRLRASRIAGLTEVPVRIAQRALEAADTLELQLVENTTQQAMPPLELAESLHRLQILRPRSLAELAVATGVGSVSTVPRLLVFLKQPESIKAMIENGELVPAVVSEIAKLKDDREKLDLAEKAVKDRLTRDQVAVLVARRNVEGDSPAPVQSSPIRRVALHLEEHRLDMAITRPGNQELTLAAVVAALEAILKTARKAKDLADLAASFKKPTTRKKPAAPGNGQAATLTSNS